MKDPDLLELAAVQDRIVVTHDCQTMTAHFGNRIESGKPAPGLFVVPQQPAAIGSIIEWLLLAWTASHAEEWRGRIVYLPNR